jgi:hypothetical protein
MCYQNHENIFLSFRALFIFDFQQIWSPLQINFVHSLIEEPKVVGVFFICVSNCCITIHWKDHYFKLRSGNCIFVYTKWPNRGVCVCVCVFLSCMFYCFIYLPLPQNQCLLFTMVLHLYSKSNSGIGRPPALFFRQSWLFMSFVFSHMF